MRAKSYLFLGNTSAMTLRNMKVMASLNPAGGPEADDSEEVGAGELRVWSELPCWELLDDAMREE